MAAVDEHAVKARLLHVGGGDGEVAGDAGHVVLVHGAHPHAGQIGGLDGADGLLPGAEGHLLLAAVNQLGQSDSAVALDAAGILAHGVEGLGILLGLGEVKGRKPGIRTASVKLTSVSPTMTQPLPPLALASSLR